MAHQVTYLVEIMKACRAQPQSRKQLAEAMGSKAETVALYVEEMVAQGILVHVDIPRPADRGHKPQGYALAAEWGGRGA